MKTEIPSQLWNAPYFLKIGMDDMLDKRLSNKSVSYPDTEPVLISQIRLHQKMAKGLVVFSRMRSLPTV